MKPRVDDGELKVGLQEIRPLFHELLKTVLGFLQMSGSRVQCANLKWAGGRIRAKHQRVLQIWSGILRVAVVPQNRSQMQAGIEIVGVRFSARRKAFFASANSPLSNSARP